MIVTTKARLVFGTVALGAVLLAACGADTTEVATAANEPADQPVVPSSAPTAEAPPETQPSVGTLPAGHVLEPLNGARGLDGSVFDLAAHPEDLPTVVWFWAPWCPNCREMATDLAELSVEYEGRLTVVGVAQQGEVDRMEEFVADTGSEIIGHVVDADGTIWQGYGVNAVPTLLFVTPDGEVEEMTGPQTRDSMVERFDLLVAS